MSAAQGRGGGGRGERRRKWTMVVRKAGQGERRAEMKR